MSGPVGHVDGMAMLTIEPFQESIKVFREPMAANQKRFVST